MVSLFGVPPYAKVLVLQLAIRDSGSANNGCLLTFSGDGGNSVHLPAVQCPQPNDAWGRGTLHVPTAGNQYSTIYRKIYASGTNTFEIYMGVLGYYI
jgi:hypothetical protein